ncbi:UNVERIFIED_CONTAM: hypothetical protein Slati_3376300 [Sesamum latifolium]|uniref:Retrotransposon gag protein n=1 Tax=Sesamum latifolium TaxID=2727402 RepID=A0AAW2UES7_9LAMI
MATNLKNFQKGPYQPPPPPPQSNSNSGMPLEDIVKTLALSIQQFQQETRSSIQNLESQVSQLASSVSRLESQVGKEHPNVFVPKPPFLERFSKSKKEEEEKDILETLRKVEVNIPLLNAIKQVPCYAKFLREMCTNKSKLKGRPFLKTSKTKIDVDAGILSMEFDNEVVSFSIDGVTQNSNDMHSVFLIDFIDPLVRENVMFDGGGASKLIKNKSPTSSPRTYKNKAFHEKISSRKKSSMNRQVLLNPHHHRVYYIEDVDLEHPTHLS